MTGYSDSILNNHVTGFMRYTVNGKLVREGYRCRLCYGPSLEAKLYPTAEERDAHEAKHEVEQ